MVTEPINPADLVGLAEIGVRAGVTTAAVVNWTQRHSSMPQPVRVLGCGPIYLWPRIAAWLDTEDMPHPSMSKALPDLPPETIAAIVEQARQEGRDYAALAARHGVSRAVIRSLLAADDMGEEFGWYTRQRRGGSR